MVSQTCLRIDGRQQCCFQPVSHNGLQVPPLPGGGRVASLAVGGLLHGMPSRGGGVQLHPGNLPRGVAPGPTGLGGVGVAPKVVGAKSLALKDSCMYQGGVVVDGVASSSDSLVGGGG